MSSAGGEQMRQNGFTVITKQLPDDYIPSAMLAPSPSPHNRSRPSPIESITHQPNPFKLSVLPEGATKIVLDFLAATWEEGIINTLHPVFSALIRLYFTSELDITTIAGVTNLTDPSSLGEWLKLILERTYVQFVRDDPSRETTFPREQVLRLKKPITEKPFQATDEQTLSETNNHKLIMIIRRCLVRDRRKSFLAEIGLGRIEMMRVSNEILYYMVDVAMSKNNGGLGRYWANLLTFTGLVSLEELSDIIEIVDEYLGAGRPPKPQRKIDASLWDKYSMAVACCSADNYAHPLEILGLSYDFWQKTTPERKRLAVITVYKNFVQRYKYDRDNPRFILARRIAGFLLTNLDADADDF